MLEPDPKCGGLRLVFLIAGGNSTARLSYGTRRSLFCFAFLSLKGLEPLLSIYQRGILFGDPTVCEVFTPLLHPIFLLDLLLLSFPREDILATDGQVTSGGPSREGVCHSPRAGSQDLIRDTNCLARLEEAG
jgi:hypothetical protein